MNKTEEFQGTERYELVARIGAGGMGVVYDALDHSSGEHIALKTLKLPDASSIYRFKREFRGLADISHPNLVSLYELVGEDDSWFFTMELVKGGTLLQSLRTRSMAEMSMADTQVLADAELREVPKIGSQNVSPPKDFDQVRRVFLQLAEGLHTLHEAGKLHRDIKPSNILVTEEERLVLLDFGLTTDYSEVDQLSEQVVVGTISYMSPEQACSGELSPASDWYSVGIVLYETLTGCVPFAGAAQAVLMNKQQQDALDPRELLPNLPDDLCELCVQLLERDPKKRPAGPEILLRLGGSYKFPAVPSSTALSSSSGDAFVGRKPQLAVLGDALAAVMDSGQPRCVLVSGVPGIGKSALVQRFSDIAVREHEAVALAGRCYERESVPLKAVDTLVDALSRYLCTLGKDEVDALLPAHTQALARLFPVLRAVGSIALLPTEQMALDPLEVRRRGMIALRQLLGAVAKTRPLILRVDDFQWGDTDSAALLANLLGPPNPPNILLCISYRRDDVATSAALQVLHARLKELALGKVVETLAVDALKNQDLEELTRLRIGAKRGDATYSELLQAVAAESEGNPFFVEEMARYLQSSHLEDEEVGKDFFSKISLEETMLSRLDFLTDEQRRLLEVIAIAGIPITQDIALRAAGIVGAGASDVSVLRAGRLLRSNHEGAVARLESYHDRIREAIVHNYPEGETRKTFRSLAAAFESLRPGEHERIADFFSRAGDVILAAEHAVLAAERAMQALAFKRAAIYFKIALQAPGDEEKLQNMREQLAEALSNAGMGVEAAHAHLEAAEHASSAIALDQKRLAADNLLRAGHVDEAVDLFKEVLHTVGLSFASSSRRSLARFLMSRATLRMRGMSFKKKDESKISPDELLKIAVCGSCALGFGMNDPIRGAEFQTKHFLLALKAGEPMRIGRAMALEAVYRALEGRPSRDAAQRIIDTARGLGEESQSPVVDAFATSAQALVHYQCGEWRPALEQFDLAASLYLTKCRGHQSVACQAERLAVDTLFILGEVGELSVRVPEILRAAEDRGDSHGVTDMRTGLPNAAWLVSGQVEQAREECNRGERQWSERAFYLQHYYSALAHIQIDLYQGKGAEALRRFEIMWPQLKRAMLLRVPVVRWESAFLHGRAILAAAAKSKGSERTRILSGLAPVAKRLAKQHIQSGKVLASMLRGQAAYLRDDKDEAIRLLSEAYEGLEAVDMSLCRHACGRFLGKEIGGSEGKEMRDKAIQWMRLQNISDSRKFSRLVLPGVMLA